MSEQLKRLQERHEHYHREGRLFDVARRVRKANKILSIMADYSSVPLDELTCLDIGCSAGMMTTLFAERFNQMIGIDVDQEAVSYAQLTKKIANVQYCLSDGARVPLPNETMDAVICAQVYEHIQDPAGLAREIYRVLKPGGFCFFSGPNRLSVMEEHTGLPFIHWFPRSIANWSVKVTGRGTHFEENLKTYWSLRRLWKRFVVIDYSPLLITSPDRFSMQDEVRSDMLAARIPAGIYRTLSFLIPNFNWILIK